jgi:hypothetical protein
MGSIVAKTGRMLDEYVWRGPGGSEMNCGDVQRISSYCATSDRCESWATTSIPKRCGKDVQQFFYGRVELQEAQIALSKRNPQKLKLTLSS